jgi:hypothetical protein
MQGHPLTQADRERIWAAVARGVRRTDDLAKYFEIDARTVLEAIKDACVYATDRIKQDRLAEKLDELSDPT